MKKIGDILILEGREDGDWDDRVEARAIVRVYRQCGMGSDQVRADVVKNATGPTGGLTVDLTKEAT